MSNLPSGTNPSGDGGRKPGNCGIIILAGCMFALVVVLWLWLGLGQWNPDEREKAGQYGDTFGSVNALFSGLAFAGVIIAIVLQMKELRYQLAEFEKSVEALQDQAKISLQAAYLNALDSLRQAYADELGAGEDLERVRVAHQQTRHRLEEQVAHLSASLPLPDGVKRTQEGEKEERWIETLQTLYLGWDVEWEVARKAGDEVTGIANTVVATMKERAEELTRLLIRVAMELDPGPGRSNVCRQKVVEVIRSFSFWSTGGGPANFWEEGDRVTESLKRVVDELRDQDYRPQFVSISAYKHPDQVTR